VHAAKKTAGVFGGAFRGTKVLMETRTKFFVGRQKSLPPFFWGAWFVYDGCLENFFFAFCGFSKNVGDICLKAESAGRKNFNERTRARSRAHAARRKPRFSHGRVCFVAVPEPHQNLPLANTLVRAPQGF
jgi:hypothetical protein